ncbi:hypothetical protein HPB52_001187 [Rhipicephalus sanguineus]|uniref:Lysophospholipid acyltransferase 5 n=1 Tax=Rhipicephalus sanguineus TaxID=34632 RepID=A0A9D4PTI6_RHISA|nr:hypothetical protein HPB52_001187 [Rhipicephalus sanguineus]
MVAAAAAPFQHLRRHLTGDCTPWRYSRPITRISCTDHLLLLQGHISQRRHSHKDTNRSTPVELPAIAAEASVTKPVSALQVGVAARPAATDATESYISGRSAREMGGGRYVFKRLRFLGNKQLSQLSALFFLALWHGLHSGYYVCFFNEFIVMKFERDALEVIERLPRLKQLIYHPYLRLPRFLLLKVYVLVMFGYCIVPFVLLSHQRYIEVR